MATYADLVARLKANPKDKIEVIDLNSKAHWIGGRPVALNGIPRLMRTKLVIQTLFYKTGQPKNNVQSARFMLASEFESANIPTGIDLNDPLVQAKLMEMGYEKKEDKNSLSDPSLILIELPTDKKGLEKFIKDSENSLGMEVVPESAKVGIRSNLERAKTALQTLNNTP